MMLKSYQVYFLDKNFKRNIMENFENSYLGYS